MGYITFSPRTRTTTSRRSPSRRPPNASPPISKPQPTAGPVSDRRPPPRNRPTPSRNSPSRPRRRRVIILRRPRVRSSSSRWILRTFQAQHLRKMDLALQLRARNKEVQAARTRSSPAARFCFSQRATRMAAPPPTIRTSRSTATGTARVSGAMRQRRSRS